MQPIRSRNPIRWTVRKKLVAAGGGVVQTHSYKDSGGYNKQQRQSATQKGFNRLSIVATNHTDTTNDTQPMAAQGQSPKKNRRRLPVRLAATSACRKDSLVAVANRPCTPDSHFCRSLQTRSIGWHRRVVEGRNHLFEVQS